MINYHFKNQSLLKLKSNKKLELKTVTTLSMLISVMFYTSSCFAGLTAVTSQMVQGTAPYLTFDGGATKSSTTDGLLGITLSDGLRITPSTNTSSATSPLMLPVAGQTFADVNMLLPISQNTVQLNTLIGPPYYYWGDDDGDGLGVSGVSASGTLSLAITDINNQVVNRTDTLDICKGPYKVQLTSTDGNLSTQYGNPNISSFSASNVIYYIIPNETKVCFATPDMSYATFQYAGPTNMWNTTKGFIPQSMIPTTYSSNFPTTGSDGLYFSLNVGGGNSSITWPQVTVGDITATMTPNSSGTIVTVKLTGPAATTAQKNSDSPGSVPKPSLPAKFELTGKNSYGIDIVNYGFEINKWFISRGKNVELTNQTTWCSSTGYLMPLVRDLTNAVGTANGYGGTIPTPIQTPSSGNYGQRLIHGGLVSEWGNLPKYTGANWIDGPIWTRELYGSYPFAVYSQNGSVVTGTLPYRGACVSN